MILCGDADIIITGGSDATISPMAVAGFSNMKALTKNNDFENSIRIANKKTAEFIST